MASGAVTLEVGERFDCSMAGYALGIGSCELTVYVALLTTDLGMCTKKWEKCMLRPWAASRELDRMRQRSQVRVVSGMHLWQQEDIPELLEILSGGKYRSIKAQAYGLYISFSDFISTFILFRS